MRNFFPAFLVLLFFLFSCKTDTEEIVESNFVPGEVLVGMESGADIDRVFDFINQYEFAVEQIGGRSFVSSWHGDSLQTILDQLNNKTYTNTHINDRVTGYIHAETGELTVHTRLYGLHDQTLQADWLATMVELELSDRHDPELSGGYAIMLVPEGREIEWRDEFALHPIVSWSELNYIYEIGFGDN